MLCVAGLKSSQTRAQNAPANTTHRHVHRTTAPAQTRTSALDTRARFTATSSMPHSFPTPASAARIFPPKTWVMVAALAAGAQAQEETTGESARAARASALQQLRHSRARGTVHGHETRSFHDHRGHVRQCVGNGHDTQHSHAKHPSSAGAALVAPAHCVSSRPPACVRVIAQERVTEPPEQHLRVFGLNVTND